MSRLKLDVESRLNYRRKRPNLAKALVWVLPRLFHARLTSFTMGNTFFNDYNDRLGTLDAGLPRISGSISRLPTMRGWVESSSINIGCRHREEYTGSGQRFSRRDSIDEYACASCFLERRTKHRRSGGVPLLPVLLALLEFTCSLNRGNGRSGFLIARNRNIGNCCLRYHKRTLAREAFRRLCCLSERGHAGTCHFSIFLLACPPHPPWILPGKAGRTNTTDSVASLWLQDLPKRGFTNSTPRLRIPPEGLASIAASQHRRFAISFAETSFIEASFIQRKNHAHRCFHFDRLAVQHIRPVAPGPHCIEGSLLQHGGSAYNV